jgi:cholest-4-en-3-one 26-monooxygenase
MQLSDIDLLDRDRFTRGVPHEWFTYLRREAPVFFHPEPGGPGFWVITKHADVITVGRDGATYSSDQKRGGVVQLEGRPEDYQFEQGGNLMLTMDAPEHTRYRKLVQPGFAPSRMRELAVRVRARADELVARIDPGQPFDAVETLAVPFPLWIIAELLGIPESDWPRFYQWSCDN